MNKQALKYSFSKIAFEWFLALALAIWPLYLTANIYHIVISICVITFNMGFIAYQLKYHYKKFEEMNE